MNWTELQKDYPKAFELFVKENWPNAKFTEIDEEKDYLCFIDIVDGPGWNYGLATTLVQLIGCRRWYDYFDEKGIHCYPDPCLCHQPPLWGYCIMELEKELTISESDPKTRKKMETHLFEKAFELLETQSS